MSWSAWGFGGLAWLGVSLLSAPSPEVLQSAPPTDQAPGDKSPNDEAPRDTDPSPSDPDQAPSEADQHWCAPELRRLELSCDDCAVCAFELGSKEPTDTLVIFLHGVVKGDSGWQHNQQRALVRAARANGFDLLAPRGRRGVGPKDMERWWTWPTRSALQAEHEPSLFLEWREARALLETGREAYKRVLLIGFSNGAYYASSLALRGAFEANGYATLAGGGANYLEQRARGVKQRPPIYVGYGLKDTSARKDADGFGKLLKRLGWPHQVKARPKVGHSMTDAQLAEALRFLRR
ncbi:MAG: hypothetical protein KIT72_08915 [Polyangiaceae bacterium]|nr:hypothetical protein [Polyangiaceae bacterium]MCW5790530.1 hypothetical protein [Polyangiaceae bacterium]